MAMTPYRLGFRVCDRRYPFLWSGPGQRSGRWNEQGNEPVHYLASSPLVAWAEWLRGQENTEPEDLDGVAAALWAVLIPESWSDAELPEVDLPIEAWCAAKQLAGWACVQAGRPFAELLPFVRHQGGLL
jgi:RES domain-containing protein